MIKGNFRFFIKYCLRINDPEIQDGLIPKF
jgi:hypothetical protein